MFSAAMLEKFGSLRRELKKSLLWGTYAAVGCLLMTLAWLLFPAPEGEEGGGQSVDVMFVLDVSGSMQGEINGVAGGISQFVQELADRKIAARVGLVAFRDRKIGEQAEVLQFRDGKFTSDPAEFRAAVSKLVANGGGDDPESSLDALVLAGQQKFRPTAEKVVLLISDAPPHEPDEGVASVAAAGESLKAQNINQLHLVVQAGDQARYTPLQAFVPGKSFQLSEENLNRESFSAMLPELGQQVALAIRSPLDPQKVYREDQRTSLMISMAAWTGVLAMGLCLALVIGQNRYLGQPLFSSKVAWAALGSFLAGTVAGVIGLLAAWALPAVIGRAPFSEQIARFMPIAFLERSIAWGVVGALVGFGMSWFVPNLKRGRAALGGVFGGILGALGLTLAGAVVGADVARLVGAGVLGFAIGLMMALAEAASRNSWLEINYGGKEQRIVNLGREPISIGSSSGSCTIFARDAAPLAYRYKLDEHDRVSCEDVVKSQTHTVSNGDRRVAGKVTVTVCTGAARSPSSPAAAPSSPFALQLSGGRRLSLGVGTTLSAGEVSGLEPAQGGRAVAEVITNPNDPAVLGLKNLSQRTWSSRTARQDHQTVAFGKSVRLAAGTVVDFGNIKGEIVPG